MKITAQGNPITIRGAEVREGQEAPNFVLYDNDLNRVELRDTRGKRVFLSVPSLDTPVCDLEVKRFNKEACNLEDVKIYVVSMDLPFAQARWCGLEEVDKVQALSDYKDRVFGENYGVYIEEMGLLARAIFVVDESNTVKYVEYCKDISDHPDYDKCLNALKNL